MRWCPSTVGKRRNNRRTVSIEYRRCEAIWETVQPEAGRAIIFAGDRDPDWRNHLIWGDKKYVLPSLPRDLRRPVARRLVRRP